MAEFSKTFNASATSRQGKTWKLELQCKFTQNDIKNTTSVKAVLKATIPSGVGNPYNLYDKDSYYVIKTKKWHPFKYNGGTTVTLGDESWTITHDAEGKATLNLPFSWYTGLGTDWSPLEIKGTAKYTLPQIKRKTSFTLDKTTLVLKDGASIVFKLKPENSSFSHVLKVNGVQVYPKPADDKYGVATQKNNNYTYVFNTAALTTLYNGKLKDCQSNTIKLTCETFSGKTSLGSTSVNLTIKADKNYCGCTLKDLSYSSFKEVNSTKKYFYYLKSTVDITVNYDKKDLFTFASMTINNSSSSTNKKTNVQLSNNKIAVVIKDKRGFSYSKTYTLSGNKIGDYALKSYIKPTASLREVERVPSITSGSSKYCGLYVYYNLYDPNEVLSTPQVKNFKRNGSSVTDSSKWSYTIDTSKKQIIIIDKQETANSEDFDSNKYDLTVSWKSNAEDDKPEFNVSSKEVAIFLCNEDLFQLQVPAWTIGNQYCGSTIKYGFNLRNSDLIGANAIFLNDGCTGGGSGGREGIFYPREAILDEDDANYETESKRNTWGSITWKDTSETGKKYTSITGSKIEIPSNLQKITMKFCDNLRVYNGIIYLNNVRVWPNDEYDDDLRSRAGNTEAPATIDDLIKDYQTAKKNSANGTYFNKNGTYYNILPRTVPSVESIMRVMGLRT